MDGLLSASRSDRKKLFDRIVYNIFPNHADLISQYEKLLSSRLKILKQFSWDPIWLTQLENQLAKLSEKINKNRINSIDIINSQIKNGGKKLIAPEITIQCKTIDMSQNEICANFLDYRNLDAKVGKSLFGCHRVEFNVSNPTKDVSASISSTGEVKMMLIDIYLALAEYLSTNNNTYNILLLDDILSHLDDCKKDMILNILLNAPIQTFISAIYKPNEYKEIIKISI